MKSKSLGAVLTLALLLWVAAMAGCSRSANVSGERTDAQVAGDVQTRISSDPALSGRQISINADKGVVTLSGAVNSDAEVTSALNDAQQAEGVKQVISRLQVQQANAAPAATEVPAEMKPAPARAATARVRSRHTLPPPSHSYQSSAQGTAVTTTSSGTTTAASDNTNAYTPPPPPVIHNVTVPAGTVLQVRTIEGLSSERNHENDLFHGTLNAEIAVEDQTAIPAGADVEGRVMESHPSTHYSGQSSLVLQLTRVSFNGKSYNLATDQWQKKGAARGKNTAEKVGAGAAVGAILGGIFGGGKGAAIGATAGAGAGAGANTITKGQPVELRPESLISFRLENPISVLPSATTRRHGTPITPDQSQ